MDRKEEKNALLKITVSRDIKREIRSDCCRSFFFCFFLPSFRFEIDVLPFLFCIEIKICVQSLFALGSFAIGSHSYSPILQLLQRSHTRSPFISFSYCYYVRINNRFVILRRFFFSSSFFYSVLWSLMSFMLVFLFVNGFGWNFWIVSKQSFNRLLFQNIDFSL